MSQLVGFESMSLTLYQMSYNAPGRQAGRQVGIDADPVQSIGSFFYCKFGNNREGFILRRFVNPLAKWRNHSVVYGCKSR